ncbi:MAG: transglutaminase-like domain-containing protein [Firmicutes bacterium]|nr:transglutaminase-like domain-containing protein [[Eubacterium] siraeum]MCM1488457.1 transglutaminase-like domain-containing protein [Bacillota bacterium]
MKKIKVIALLTAFCLYLCGCNHDPSTPSNISETAEAVSNTVTPDNSEQIPEDTDVSQEITAGQSETVTSSSSTASSTDSSSESSNDTSESLQTDIGTEENTSTAENQSDTEIHTAHSSEIETEPPVTTTTAAPEIPSEPSPPTIYATTADGVLTTGNALATIDYSNTSDGYIMAKYTGSVSLIKIQITNPAGTTQTYTLNSNGKYEAFPLTGNNGNYSFRVLENVPGTTGYALAHSGSFQVQLASSLAPYLRPSSYVPYSYGDSAVTKSSELCGGAANDLEKVDRVYTWLVDNVVYDYDLASSKIAGGYVADTEKVINRKKGICLDYAGTMAAMLRSQNIPVQVVSGHTSGSTSLHAWVNVYVTDVGWIYGAIYFDGTAWHRLDPTYAASSNSSNAILSYIGDGNNYYAEQLN